MASTSEVGHAKNVANFYDLISFVTGYGATYNPTKTSLKLAQLNNLHSAAQANLSDVIDKNAVFNKKVNNRVAAFSDLKPLATRLLSALDATDATSETMADAKGYVRKLRGKSSSSSTPIPPETPAPSTISTSQQSYDQQIQHFSGLISVLQSEPSYSPNENDLKIATVSAKQADLSSKNNEVADAYTDVSNSRIARNNTLYATDSGLVETASEVKKYVKSIFGASSPQYAQVKGIQFRTIPN